MNSTNKTAILKRFILLIVLTLNSVGLLAHSNGKKPVILIHNSDIPRSEKEALIILPGLGDKNIRRKKQLKYFKDFEYDLFIPDYIDRKSIEDSAEKFKTFYINQSLSEYKKVHVLAYILGSWVINEYIIKYGSGNITSIIYDRSPLQERAPKVLMMKMPHLATWLKGHVLEDLSLTNYVPIKRGNIKIGIIVESKATTLIRIFKKATLRLGAIDWQNLNFNQEYDDLIYTRLNHDEMYYTFCEIGSDIISFFETGRFNNETRRVPFKWDPFKKYKNELIRN